MLCVCRGGVNILKAWTYTLILYLQTSDVDIDDEVSEIGQAEPYIAIVGKVGCTAEYHIVLEGKVLFESSHMSHSVFDLFATYYIFNITYHKSILSLLLF